MMRPLIVSTLLFAACGSSPQAHEHDTAGQPRDELAGLVWGASRAALEQRFPGARSEGQSLQWTGTYTGRAARLTLLPPRGDGPQIGTDALGSSSDNST